MIFELLQKIIDSALIQSFQNYLLKIRNALTLSTARAVFVFYGVFFITYFLFFRSSLRFLNKSSRSTFRSCNSARAIINFSCGTKLTPLVCSPSRKVVSMISIFTGFAFILSKRYDAPNPLSFLCFPTGSRYRRAHSSNNISCIR